MLRDGGKNRPVWLQLQGVSAPPAFRKDTQQIPWKLYLVLLILQFSPPERRERQKEREKERERKREGEREITTLQFPLSVKPTKEMSGLRNLHHPIISLAVFLLYTCISCEHRHTPADIFFFLHLLMEQVMLSTCKKKQKKNSQGRDRQLDVLYGTGEECQILRPKLSGSKLLSPKLLSSGLVGPN